MSVEAMAAVLNLSRSKGTARLVLLGIANHDGDGGAWPSVATLARYANVKERAVQKAIAELVELGEVVVYRNAGGTHLTRDDRRPNRYHITLGNGVSERAPRDLDGVHQDAERGAPDGPDGVHARAPEPSLEPPKEPSSVVVAVAPPRTAQDLVGIWLDNCRQRPPARVIGQVARELGSMIDEGIPVQAVHDGLARWHMLGLHPSALASVVNEVLNPPAGRQATTTQRVNEAVAVSQRLAGRQ